MDENRKKVFEKSKVRGAQRIVFDLKKKGEVTFLAYNGKRSSPATALVRRRLRCQKIIVTHCLLF
ncbi:MAG: hypothetical protein CM15mP130_2980 [Verrucomicrobiota bacterium]|nr:MAG: hypothetical protein CM15mP130_2980 [Verrucomicrobiota bacterium]